MAPQPTRVFSSGSLTLNRMERASEDPFSSPVTRITTARAKRDATTAQILDDGSAARIRQKAQEFSTHMEKASLERRLIAIEAERKELEARLIQKEKVIAKLESDRRWLADREKEEREEKEEERREHEEEKRQTAATLRTLRIEVATLRDELAELQDAHTALKRTTSQIINSQKSQIVELTRRSEALEDELNLAKQLSETHEKNGQELRQMMEDQAVQLSTASVDGQTTPNGVKSASKQDWEILNSELHRQTTHLRDLERTNARLTGELASFKERHTSIEVLKEEKRDLERKARAADALREQVVRLEEDLADARRKGLSASQMGSNAAGMIQELADLRLRNALMQEEMGSFKATIRARDLELQEAKKREEGAKAHAERTAAEVKEVRDHVLRREARLALAEKEIVFLKDLIESFKAEEDAVKMEDVTKIDEGKDTAWKARVDNLEETVEKLKAENEKLEREVVQRGDQKLGTGRGFDPDWEGFVKKLEESQARVVQLESEISAAQVANDSAATKIDSLEQSLFELQGDVAAGQHVPPNTRVLCLRDNPMQQWADMRTEVLERLKKENEALLRRVEELETSGARVDSESGAGEAAGLVPRESWEKERKEKEDLEEVVKQKEKRLLRLQQIYASKAKEFREAMSSILGYKVHFFSNGQVRVTSQYDLNASFVFQPSSSPLGNGDDDDGMKMQLAATGDSNLPDLAQTINYWVNERMCIPGLMASVTLECYDRTERGRRQGWGRGSD
ncbi:hypothetical protein M422DRAFT_242402 [Sphaerobolus stellatus SS14]|nr:hypothetical protein M422DRAFT_242402 [Sphaerobolus stellatus SS14]